MPAIQSNFSKRRIRALINESDVAFLQCWEVLCSMKEGKVSREELLSFQPTLARSLLDLSSTHNNIAEEKRRLVERKDSLTPTWFARRMKVLSDYQRYLGQTVAIGKMLGDAFIWPFYGSEPQLIRDHLKHEADLFMPTGVGGAGEVGFISQIPIVEGCFVLYHGITNLLRIGDVTLVDVKTNKVIAIGEVKSKELDPKNIMVRIIFAGERPGSMSDSVEQVHLLDESSPFEFDLPPARMDRFQRQLERMNEVITSSIPMLPGEIATLQDSYAAELEVLLGQLKVGKLAYQQASEGLLLIGRKFRKSSLASKLIDRDFTLLPEQVAEIEEKAAVIVNTEWEENYATPGVFHYSDGEQVYVMAGAAPLFWWPVNLRFIKQIIFLDVLIFTFYNQAHLNHMLEDAGFKVEFNKEERELLLRKSTEQGELVLKNLMYFIRLIRYHLASEAGVITTIQHSAEAIEAHELPPNSIVELLMKPILGQPPSNREGNT